jgi:hypothetical protein
MPQNADGTPHFTFFDQPSQMSFIWDGNSSCIEVSHGGYGEPAIDHIQVVPRAGIANASAQRWMELFQLVCTNYIRLKVGDKEGTE